MESSTYAYAYYLISGVLSCSIYTVECGSILLKYSEITIVKGRVMNKEMVYEEISKVREEMEENSEGERNFLEGWEKALLWVIRQLESEGK